MPNFSYPLIFMRHGETLWNQEGRYQGVTETELSREGIRQAEYNADLVNQLAARIELDPKKTQIVSSSLLRAKQTATIIAETVNHDPPVNIDTAFRELSLGRWEGLTSQQVKDRFYVERKQRKSDRWNFAPQNGESMAHRHPIVRRSLENLKSHTIVITHSGILRILLHVLGNQTINSAAAEEFLHIGLYVWDGAILHRQA